MNVRMRKALYSVSLFFASSITMPQAYGLEVSDEVYIKLNKICGIEKGTDPSTIHMHAAYTEITERNRSGDDIENVASKSLTVYPGECLSIHGAKAYGMVLQFGYPNSDSLRVKPYRVRFPVLRKNSRLRTTTGNLSFLIGYERDLSEIEECRSDKAPCISVESLAEGAKNYNVKLQQGALDIGISSDKTQTQSSASQKKLDLR